MSTHKSPAAASSKMAKVESEMSPAQDHTQSIPEENMPRAVDTIPEENLSPEGYQPSQDGDNAEVEILAASNAPADQ